MIHIIDGFFDRSLDVREEALSCDFRHHSEVPGVSWIGHRTERLPRSINVEYLKAQTYRALGNEGKSISDIDCYYHYTSEEDMKHPNWLNKYHTDDEYSYAGVVYLSKDPIPERSGTDFEEGKHTIENVWNRYVLWNAGIRHAIENTFGNSIDDARLTLSFFVRF